MKAHKKVGDLDPRGDRGYCFTVSDKSLPAGGGVVEAVLTWMTRREHRLPPSGQAARRPRGSDSNVLALFAFLRVTVV